jgi:hypothetical protein
LVHLGTFLNYRTLLGPASRTRQRRIHALVAHGLAMPLAA